MNYNDDLRNRWGTGLRRRVAQICNLLYPRIAFGRSSESRLPARISPRVQIANLRYSRLQICATPVLLSLFTLDSAATAGASAFSNPSPIVINDSVNPPTVATPYPSTIVVTGMTGQVVGKITVTLHGFSHQFPDDVDILLVGPQGQKATIMSNVGGSTPGYPVTNLTLTLDDDAATSLPLEAPLVSGTFKPTKRLPYLLFDFPSPAPAGSSNAVAALSVFQGTDPNGTWSMYVVDDANPDAGCISGGWSLTVSAVPVMLSIANVETNVVISWTNALMGFTLQTSPTLPPAATWANALPAPALVSGQFMVTNPAVGAERFYRLAK